MDKNIFMSILKYSLLTLIVYLVLKYLPNQYLNESDLVFITVIIVLFYLLSENVIKIFTKEENFINTSLCNSICDSRMEHMANVVQSETPVFNKALDDKKKERENDEKDITATLQKEKVMKETLQKEKVMKETIQKEDKEEDKEENNDDSSVMDDDEEEEKDEKKEEKKKEKYSYDEGRNMIMKTHPKPMKGVERDITRQEAGTIVNEIEYTDYNHLPLADGYNVGDFEYGYSFLPPEKWYPEPPFPPLCVSEKRCPVMPSYTTGTPLDVKEWNEARRVTPPDNIKTKYIKEKLNSGR